LWSELGWDLERNFTEQPELVLMVPFWKFQTAPFWDQKDSNTG